MNHDPLCPMWGSIEAASEGARALNAAGAPVVQPHYEGVDPFHVDEVDVHCQCDLIAKVRADERGKYASEWLGANNLHSKEITE